MSRPSVGTALALLGALVASAAGTVTANASPAATPDAFTVVSVGVSASVADELTVVVNAPSTITGLTASLLSGTVDEYDATLTSSSSAPDPTDPTQTQTVWQATIPTGTSPSGLAIGYYSVNLSATYSDSGTSSVTNAGWFAYRSQATVTLTASDPQLTYPHTSTALSGTVTLTNPDGTPFTDWAGLSAEILSSDGQGPDILPVSSTGTFSDPNFTPELSSTTESAEIVSNGEILGTSSAVAITTQPATPTLTLKVNPVTETYGQTATVAGTLTYISGSTSVPVSGQQIWVSPVQGGNAGGGPQWSGTTGTDGSFSIAITEKTGTTLYVGSTVAPNQRDLTAVETQVKVNVVNPTVISNLKVSLDQNWGLSVSGCLGFASGNTTQQFYQASGLTVQYASSKSGPWINLYKVNSYLLPHCGTGGIEFAGDGTPHTAPLNYAYYRVVYAGTTGATSYAPSVSSAVLAWRYFDRITGLKVSPTLVNAGGKLTISGTLQYYYSGWHSYGGQVIYIDYHPKGSNPTWYWIVKVTTNSKGQFSATFKDPTSATWQAAFLGNNTSPVGHLSAGSAEVYVRLK